MIGIICAAILLFGVIRLYEGYAKYDFPVDAHVMRFKRSVRWVIFVIAYTYILWLKPFNELVYQGSEIHKALWYLIFSLPLAFIHIRMKLYYLLVSDTSLSERVGKKVKNINYLEVDFLKIIKDIETGKTMRLDFYRDKQCSKIFVSYTALKYEIRSLISTEELVELIQSYCIYANVKVENINEESPSSPGGA